MAKGLGSIMAEVDMERKKSSVDSIVYCPFCKGEMEYNGAAWFCVSVVNEYRPSERFSCSPSEEMRKAFFDVPKGEGGWKDGFTLSMEPGVPCAMAAAVVVDGYPIADIRFVRPGGWRVGVVGGRIEPDKVPAAINEHGWTYYDWSEPK